MNRKTLWLALPVLLLLGVWLLPAQWHLLIAVVTWLLMRWRAKDLLSSLGRPSRWAWLLLVFAVLGGVFGPSDTQWGELSWSLRGSLAAVTMMARALGLIVLGAMISALLPVRSWIQNARNPALRRVAGVVVIAANFVPALIQIIAEAGDTLRDRRPGLLLLPQRFELLAVHTAVRAANLAQEVAFDMTLAAHNARPTVPALCPGNKEP